MSAPTIYGLHDILRGGAALVGYGAASGFTWCLAPDCASAAARHQDFWAGNDRLRAVLAGSREAGKACECCDALLGGPL